MAGFGVVWGRNSPAPARCTRPWCSSPEPERKVAQDNPAARKWKAFYKKIETRGENEAENPRGESNDPLANYSEAEREDLLVKLNSLRHEYFVPRMLKSVIDQVFYVVETTRYNLRSERRWPEWSATVALEMYQFYTALEQAIQSAKEVEQATGFSGAEVSAGLAEE